MLTVYRSPKYGEGKTCAIFVGKVLTGQAVFYTGDQDTRAYVDSILASKIRQGKICAVFCWKGTDQASRLLHRQPGY